MLSTGPVPFISNLIQTTQIILLVYLAHILSMESKYCDISISEFDINVQLLSVQNQGIKFCWECLA